LVIPDHALGAPVLRTLSLCTCCRHYPGAAAGPITSLIHPAVSAFPERASAREKHQGLTLSNRANAARWGKIVIWRSVKPTGLGALPTGRRQGGVLGAPAFPILWRKSHRPQNRVGTS
jgi:hypothetical protein